MRRSYRIYRNMDRNTKDANPICIELLQFPNLYWWMVSELHEAVEECCSLFHHMPIPRWLANWESDWGCDCSPANTAPLNDDGCACWGTFAEYYGDDWGSMWHCFLEMPLSQHIYKNLYKDKGYLMMPYFVFVNVSLDEWRDRPDDPDVKWIREDIDREKAYPKDENGYSTVPHRCNYTGQSWLYKIVEWATRPWRTALCDGTGPENQHGVSG